MASNTYCSSCSNFLSVPTTPPLNFPTVEISKQIFNTHKNFPHFSVSHTRKYLLKANPIPFSSSTSSTPIVQEDEQAVESSGNDELPLDSVPTAVNQESDSFSSTRGCNACGQEEIERGCNGEGRIQGGIATVPGFGWWPIKAYRPCPGFVASGGRYRRIGQSMDEVAFGRGDRGASMGIDDEGKSRKKKEAPTKFKK